MYFYISETRPRYIDSMKIEIILAFIRIILLSCVITLMVLIATKISNHDQKSFNRDLNSSSIILNNSLSTSPISSTNPNLKSITYEIGPTSSGTMKIVRLGIIIFKIWTFFQNVILSKLETRSVKMNQMFQNVVWMVEIVAWRTSSNQIAQFVIVT